MMEKYRTFLLERFGIHLVLLTTSPSLSLTNIVAIFDTFKVSDGKI